MNDTQIIYSMMGVSKTINRKEIIKDISLSFYYGAKIGVLGLNGSGKSTLLKIMAGLDTEYEGKITAAGGYGIGYLEQEPLAGETRTVLEVVEEGVSEIKKMLACCVCLPCVLCCEHLAPCSLSPSLRAPAIPPPTALWIRIATYLSHQKMSPWKFAKCCSVPA